MSAPAYQYILWDWNGTLFNDAWLCVDVMNALLARRGLPLLTPARYQEVFDFPVRRYYERLGFDFGRESFEQLGTEFIEMYNRRRFECELQPGARSVLDAVHQAGRRQSILSAYQESTLREIVTHFGVTGYFDRLIGLDDHLARGKAHLARAWIRETGIDPGAVLLVGDTVHDHEVAAEMGADCVLIPGGNHTRAKLLTCGVPVLDSLADLPRVIRGERP
jgi:phosphoglycolate phosphatase